MKKSINFLPKPTPKHLWKDVRLFVASLFFSFLFLGGAVIMVQIYAPVIPSIVISFFSTKQNETFQLPSNKNRVIPFSTSAPALVIQPYPRQERLDPPYNSAESSSDWIRIPAIGVNVPLTQSPSLKDADVLATLNTGAALYPNGVPPGGLGNTFISAHSTGEPWKGAYRFAFIKINELKEGDALHIDWKSTRYSYRIFKSEIITPTVDFLVTSDRPVPTVSLMACWPLWSTKQRMLIHAELTNITPLVERP